MMTPRLQVIADNVLKNESMADIGTDHGYLPVYLMEEGIVTAAVAADINQKPLKKAADLVERSGFAGQVETRLGSGLTVLKPGEVATIVMAGMGGYLIRDLLKEAPAVADSAKRLVLQPMNNAFVVRHYLEDSGFKIIDEALAKEERRIYEIIIAEKGEMSIENDLDYLIGYRASERRHPLLPDLIDRKLELEYKIIDSTKDKKTKMAREQYQKSTAIVAGLMEVKNGCKMQ